MKFQAPAEATEIINKETAFAKTARKYSFLGQELKDVNDSVYVRFLDDYVQNEDQNFILTVTTHGFVPTKDKPEGWPDAMNWPEQMRALCRTQKMLQGEHDDCFICAHITKEDSKHVDRPWPRNATIYMRAVAMEKIKITQQMVDEDETGRLKPAHVGKASALRDVMVEIEEDGKKIKQPKLYLIEQQVSNFLDPLKVYADEHGTILDRPYKIVRMGIKKDTSYAFVEQPEAEDFREAKNREKYDAIFSWKELTDYVDYRHSDDFFEKYFDTRVQYVFEDTRADSKKDDEKPAAKAAPAKTEQKESLTSEQMDAVKRRMLGNRAPAPTVEDTAEAETAVEEEEVVV